VKPHFSPADVPELIRMATDPALHEAASETAQVFAPVHAWRALRELRPAEAAEPLARLLEERREDYWVFDEVPDVLGWIGPPALPLAVALLGRVELDPYLRVVAARTVSLVGERYPEARGQAIAILARQLEAWPEQDPALNGFLITYLGDHQATDAAPLMRAAFEDHAVDTSVCGDWEDVQVKLGLLAERIHPRPRPLMSYLMDGFRPPALPAREPRPGGRAQSASRRKAQKASRKQNRKRR
jgi:hypothetical protein